MAALDFKEMFDGWVGATQKQWGHDRTKTLGGSEAFGCLRKAWYARNNTPKDPDYEDNWGALRRGDIIENSLVVPVMEWASKEYGFEFMLGGENQQTLFDKSAMRDVVDETGEVIGQEPGGLSVTPDGLITGVKRDALSKYGIKNLGSNCFMLEIKSIDPRVDLSEEKAIHHGQTQIQMGLIRENTPFRPNYAVILYINASFLDDIEVYVVQFDERKYQVAKDRAHLVYNTTDPSKLMREGKIDGSCQYCPYQRACMGTVAEGMPDKAKTNRKAANYPEEFDERLQKLLAEKRQTRFARKQAEKADEEVGEEIKNLCREMGVSNPKNPEAGWSVSYTIAGGRMKLDRDRVESEFNISLKDYETQGDPYEILRVTYKEDKGVDE